MKTEYDNLKLDISNEENNLKELLDSVKTVKQKIDELKDKEKKLVSDTLGDLEGQKCFELNKQDSRDYFKMIDRWKEEYKNDQLVRLDKLTGHYLCMTNRLSKNRQFILSVLVKAGTPLSINEIAKEFRDKKITSSYVSSTLNGDGMYHIRKNKSYKFEIFERDENGKIFISSKDKDFYPYLVMRYSKSLKYLTLNNLTPENYKNNPVDYFIEISLNGKYIKS